MDGNRLGTRLPNLNRTDPGALESWYGPGGFVEDWRKVVVANCREMVRATATLKKVRLSEKRIDDLAHLHDSYLSFLTDQLEGRRLREAAIREPMGLR